MIIVIVISNLDKLFPFINFKLEVNEWTNGWIDW